MGGKMSESQNQYIARLVALVHDKKQALAPAVVVVNNIAKWLRKLMSKSFIFLLSNSPGMGFKSRCHQVMGLGEPHGLMADKGLP